jgi:gas vesicle protein
MAETTETTKTDKFKTKMDAKMDQIRAHIVDLKAKADKVEVGARAEAVKSLDALDKAQGDLMAKIDQWVKAGKESGEELKKGIKLSAKELKKAVKEAYKKLP